jgi:hypothetical protein
MAIQFKIYASSLRLNDLDTGKIILLRPTKEIWYREARLQLGLIDLYDANDHRAKKSLANLQLIDCLDPNGTTFTEESFRTFVYNNLCYNPIVKSVSFITEILAQSGGFAVNNICYA